MGGASWGTNHAFSLPENDAKDLNLTITISIGQSDHTLEYLEPVLVEYSLQNISRKPIELDHRSTEYDQPVLPEEILDIFVKYEKPNVKDQTVNNGIRRIEKETHHLLLPGKEINGCVFVTIDNSNWIIQKPGHYKLNAILHLGDRIIASNTIEMEVDKPKDLKREKELAKRFYNPNMARTMLLDGTRGTKDSDPEFNLLKEISEDFSYLRLSIHANIALAMPLREPFKYIDFEKQRIKKLPANIKESIKFFEKAFTRVEVAKATLGKTDFNYYFKIYQELKAKYEVQRTRKISLWALGLSILTLIFILVFIIYPY